MKYVDYTYLASKEAKSIQKTKEIYDKLRSILTGQESIKLYLEFLKRNNHADLLILKHTKVGFVSF